MKITTACSTKSNINDIVKDLQSQIGDFQKKMVVYYASSAFDPDMISKEMQAGFPGVTVLGCSTAGEITSGKMLNNSIVAMAFDDEAMKDVEIAVIEDLKDEKGVEKAFAAFEKYYGIPMLDMNPSRYVGMILVDGLSGAEEKLMERIGEMTDILFVGGSAGDDLKFEGTHVYANGKSYQNAAVLALMKPGTKFTFIKTQSFSILPEKLVVSKADEANREVIEFNGKPAVVAYAEALGIPAENADSRFMHNPVGLVVNEEPYVRSPQRVSDGKMKFYCGVMEGMELSLLESQDIIEGTRKALENAKTELGNISAIINFNCILRTLELIQKQATDDYGCLFTDIPTIGFSTYGEQFIGHINQTATMLAFK
jgi:hypothetical protein